MEGRNIITKEIKDQIEVIRISGATNMFDLNMVQRLAFKQDFHELVCLIEEDKKAYVNYIMYGKEN